MEDDDEFGDLYTDVLRPFSSSTATVKSSPDPLAGVISFDRIQPFRSTSHDPKTIDASVSEDGGEGWMLGRAPPAVEPPANWNDDDDEEDVPVRPREEGHSGVSKEERARVSEIPEGGANMAETEGSGNQEVDGGIGENMEVGDLGHVLVIPGLAATPAAPAAIGPSLVLNGGDSKPSASEDWDSDSEDDLQIVLNDNNHGLLPGDRDEKDGIEDDDDEDGEEDLVIVTGGEEQHRHLPAMDEQDWGEEGMQAVGDVKDLGEAGKGIGVVGSAPATRIGYSNHGFHAQHHSMFKYIRPGAAPVSGSPISGAIGLPGQVRPSLSSGPIAGRGRGDWRPAGGRGITNAQKGFPSSYGAWTNNSSARAFGSGLDFSLPPHKTVFDIEIDSFEEKPWRHPGVDISDFFNFGLDEEKWKDYCKQLGQLRLESTMQSKIRVYESGRSEQEYDPDLPPELAAAAAGHHDISSDNRHHGKADTGLVDFNGQGRGPVNIRPPLPTGRAIQVEGGYGERLPSIDTRPPRMRDADAIIEIALEDSLDDQSGFNGAVAQPDKAFQGDRFKGSHEIEEVERHATSEYVEPLPHNFKGNKRDATRRPTKGDDLSPFSIEAPVQYPSSSKMRSPVHGGALGIHRGERSPEGISRRRHSSMSGENSDDVILCQPASLDKHDDDHREVESTEINETLEVSPAVAVEASKELSSEDRSDEHDDKVALGDSIEAEGEDGNSDFHVSSEIVNDSLVRSGKKQKLSSQVEQPVIQDNCDEGEIRTSHSDNSRAKSGSSKEYQRHSEQGEEVMQDGRLRRMSDSKRRREREEPNLLPKDEYHQDAREIDRSRIASRGKEDIYHPYGHRDIDSASTHAVRGRSFERPREADVWHRREDNIHSRRVEEIRREQSAEASSRQRDKMRSSERNDRDGYIHLKKRMDDGDWRGHSKDRGSRQRERDDATMSRRDSLDDSHIRKKKDEENLKRGKADKEQSSHGFRAREDSSRSKRERDDGIDQRRREDSIRMRDKAEEHYSAKHKDDGGRIRENEDRQRHKQPHDNTLIHREREEGRGAVRSGRVGSARDKEDSKSIGFDKDYQEKDRRRQNERPQRDRSGEENAMHHKGRGDAHSRDKQLNNDERGSRHERTNPYHDRQQIYRERNSVSTKKLKEPIEQNTRGPGKGRHEDSIANRNKKSIMGGTSEQESSSIPSAILSKKGHTQIHQEPDVSFMKQEDEDLASDDENLEDSRRGRSKLERWTSHDERDYITIDSTKTFSTSKVAKEVTGSNVDIIQEDVVGNTEGTDNVGDVDPKGGDTGQVAEKMGENRDRHLDTVAKLKRRSERFKPLLPGEETGTNRKVENEVHTSQNEAADIEVKLERPARKRRWTGS
ncbi:FIP1[V]-like protein [Typha angustifolia]|uniref:FIP1[V]-like protein n=1 Tax=Typha angustifolia TaxID=59011 RepID=UPI003C2F66F9